MSSQSMRGGKFDSVSTAALRESRKRSLDAGDTTSMLLDQLPDNVSDPGTANERCLAMRPCLQAPSTRFSVVLTSLNPCIDC